MSVGGIGGPELSPNSIEGNDQRKTRGKNRSLDVKNVAVILMAPQKIVQRQNRLL